MMRKLIKNLFALTIHLWSLFYDYDMSNRLRRWKSSIYSLWIRNFIGSIGENSEIFYPCKLWGGGQKWISIGNNTTFTRIAHLVYI